jgi:alkylated DNA repair dioxygenase AlkB
MKSRPLSDLPKTSKLAGKLAGICSLAKKEWNIGLDLLMYRDGKDNINWHSDDTREEDTVLSLTVESPDNPRTICF